MCRCIVARGARLTYLSVDNDLFVASAKRGSSQTSYRLESADRTDSRPLAAWIAAVEADQSKVACKGNQLCTRISVYSL